MIAPGGAPGGLALESVSVSIASICCMVVHMATAEEKLFGTYVKDVSTLVDLVRTTYSVVVGSAVLHCLLDSPSWDAGGLDIVTTFLREDELENSLGSFKKYFLCEGYSVVASTSWVSVGIEGW